MSLRTFPRRAARALRTLALGVLRVQRVLFFETHVHADASAEPALPAGLRWVVVEQPEAQPHREALIADLGMRAEQLQARQARGNVALLAFDADRAVAMLWISFAQQAVSEVGSVLTAKAGEFITFDEKTVPAYRGRGISPALNRLACLYAQERGATRQLLWRKASNAPALRVAEKVGQRCIATSVAVMLFGMRVYFSIDEVAGVGLDLLM